MEDKMKRLISVLFVIFMGLFLFFSFGTATAEDKFTVSGDVFLSGENSVYIHLINAEAYKTFKKNPPGPPFMYVINKNSPLIKKGSCEFKFTNIPKGDYIVFAYVDANENGKLDVDTWGMLKETACFHRESMGMVSWHDQKFTVDRDVGGIQLFR
jgi:hypothetical protein